MTTPERLAFEVTIDSNTCVVFARTAAKARWIAVKSYWEAGYGRQGTWPRPSARRKPELDSIRLAAETRQKAWCLEYAYSTL